MKIRGRHAMKQWVLFLLPTLALISAGCAQPLRGTKVLDHALAGKRALIPGDGFHHLIYRNGNWDQQNLAHVYLEGDGLPWVTRARVARDPTPRNPLALRLMARDPAPSLYLGRPCYHGLADSPNCSPWLWTHGRYSEKVVRSMTAALRRALAPEAGRELVLIGYSGGGVLAMLIAARLEQVTGVVTIAADLDINAWADYHGYSRLRGSINPATQPPLPATIHQIHLAGSRDGNVPPHLFGHVLDRQPNARFLIQQDFDHRCCWERDWPAILNELGTLRAGQSAHLTLTWAARAGDGRQNSNRAPRFTDCSV
jgi:hypothetical protein